jgi:hypothetical protein
VLLIDTRVHPLKSAQSITSIPASESTDKDQIEAPPVVLEPDHHLANRLQMIGICVPRVMPLIALYGRERIGEVCEQVEKRSLSNPAGYFVRAVRENGRWKRHELGNGMPDGKAYVSGAYADFTLS